MNQFQAIGRLSRSVAFAAAVALAATAVSPSIAAAQDNAAEQAPKVEKKVRKYCADTEITGTRVRQRECKTREAWIKENGFDPLAAR